MKLTTVNRLNKTHGIPRDYTRKRIAAGTCPGFWSGRAFKIDEDSFLAMLEAECQQNARGRAVQ